MIIDKILKKTNTKDVLASCKTRCVKCGCPLYTKINKRKELEMYTPTDEQRVAHKMQYGNWCRDCDLKIKKNENKLKRSRT